MRSRFGTRLVKAFLSSSYAILYCVLQPVLAGCISCHVFATNGGNQSRKLNKHIDFNEIVKLFSFFSNLVSTCFHMFPQSQDFHYSEKSLDITGLRPSQIVCHGLGVHLRARCSGLDAGFALKRDSSENWVMTAVSPCQSSTSNRHKCHLPIWLWHRQLSSLGI